MNTNALQSCSGRYLNGNILQPGKSTAFIPHYEKGMKMRQVELKAGSVLRLEKSSGMSGIQVREGVVWVTETPADGDVFLQAGDRFEFSGHWPVVIQAMGGGGATLLA